MNFETLANENKDAVYRHLIRVCGNREDAEDVLIDALLKAYSNLDQLRDSAAFRAWLAQIARRACWQLKQREALRPVLQLSTLEDEGQELQDAMPPLDVQVAKKEMKELLRRAVAQLEEPYRTVYQLRDVEELSGEEVTRRLKISLPAMKSRLHRARQSVRQFLDDALASSSSVR